MGKILLTEDYGKIVKRGFLQPERDLTKFYTRITEKHFSKNPDMFTELKSMINDYIQWYKGEVIGGTVPTEMPDGTIKYFDRNQTWESDGDGDYTKWVKHDLFEHKIFLYPLSDAKNVRVNKSFFDNHLRIIEDIERQQEIKKLDIQINILERIGKNIEIQFSKSKPTLTGFQSSQPISK